MIWEKEGEKSVQGEYKAKQVYVFATIASVSSNRLDQVIEKISNLCKLLRITFLVFRFFIKLGKESKLVDAMWRREYHRIWKCTGPRRYIQIPYFYAAPDFHQYELSIAKRVLISLTQHRFTKRNLVRSNVRKSYPKARLLWNRTPSFVKEP